MLTQVRQLKKKSPIDCQDTNLLYELHCKKDSLPYIGKTSKTAEDRFVGPLNTILQDCHSNTKTHSHTDIQVTPPFVRKAYENIDFYWGKVLQSTKKMLN